MTDHAPSVVAPGTKPRTKMSLEMLGDPRFHGAACEWAVRCTCGMEQNLGYVEDEVRAALRAESVAAPLSTEMLVTAMTRAGLDWHTTPLPMHEFAEIVASEYADLAEIAAAPPALDAARLAKDVEALLGHLTYVPGSALGGVMALVIADLARLRAATPASGEPDR